MLVRVDSRPTEPLKGIKIDVTTSVHTPPAVGPSIPSLSGPTIALAAVQNDSYVVPVRKLLAQVFVAIQPSAGDDEEEHVPRMLSVPGR